MRGFGGVGKDKSVYSVVCSVTWSMRISLSLKDAVPHAGRDRVIGFVSLASWSWFGRVCFSAALEMALKKGKNVKVA